MTLLESSRKTDVLSLCGFVAIIAGPVLILGDVAFHFPIIGVFLRTHAALVIGVLLLAAGMSRLLWSKTPTNSRSFTAAEQAEMPRGMKWVETEIASYTRLLTHYAWFFSVLKIAAMVCTASIPVIAALGIKNLAPWSAGLAGGAAFCEGMLQVFKYQENWVNAAATRGLLERESALCLSQAGPYKGTESERSTQLVSRAAEIIGAEYKSWSTNLLRGKQNRGDDKTQD